MPADARILSIQMQHNRPQIWALVSDDAPTRMVVLHIIETGQDIGEAAKAEYVGTVQDGIYVWHLFKDGRLGE